MLPFIITSLLIFLARAQPTLYENCNLNVCAHADGTMIVEYSNDNGSTWTQIGGPLSSWPTPISYSIDDSPLSIKTKLRFTVLDLAEGNNGFIANINLITKGVSGPAGLFWTSREFSFLNTFDVIDSTNNYDYVFTPLGNSPFGSNFLQESCLDDSTENDWVWNDGTQNEMTFTFSLADEENWLQWFCQGTPATTTIAPVDEIIEYQNCEINLCAHGSDRISIEYSPDAGETWSTVAGPLTTSGSTSLSYSISDDSTIINSDSQFRFTVTELYGGRGGAYFISMITLNGLFESNTWVSQNPIDDVFEVWDSSNDYNYVYYDYRLLIGSCLDKSVSPKWVWNQQVSNTMTFTFKLDQYQDILQQVCSSTRRPTANPTVSTTEPTPSPTTQSPTTSTPTTAIPTTVSPTTKNPTANPTAEPSIDATTNLPTTVSPTTAQPTTADPTTANPTTLSPTTAIPTTLSPTTKDPTPDPTAEPSPMPSPQPTLSPTIYPIYDPTTDSPTTSSPTSARPTTADPTTADPTTSSPTTDQPTIACNGDCNCTGSSCNLQLRIQERTFFIEYSSAVYFAN